jgi:hypothetical protein
MKQKFSIMKGEPFQIIKAGNEGVQCCKCNGGWNHILSFCHKSETSERNIGGFLIIFFMCLEYSDLSLYNCCVGICDLIGSEVYKMQEVLKRSMKTYIVLNYNFRHICRVVRIDF